MGSNGVNFHHRLIPPSNGHFGKDMRSFLSGKRARQNDPKESKRSIFPLFCLCSCFDIVIDK